MRVTRESLIRIAKETVQQRAFNDRAIIAAYLTGALVQDDVDPILGGTADIDIIFVHADEPKYRREFVKLTPHFHVDIGHRSRGEFKRPRELRVDPWLGWEMFDPKLLYEREKFFEFIQAGLRAGFEFSGDIVEIFTSPGQTPNQEWLSIVKTSRARHKIRHWLNNEQKNRSIELGRRLIEREAKRYKRSMKRLLGSKEMADQLDQHGFGKTEDLFAAVGFGKLSAKSA